MQRDNVFDGLDHCLAYQTPPYESRRHNEAPSPESASSNSSELLINQIAKLLSRLTMNRCTTKIKNDSTLLNGFLKEVLKRSKCNKKVVLLSTLYFQKIDSTVDEVEELPEFAKCSKRIFLSCLILAHKFLNDNTFTLKTWNLISGLNPKDLAYMERWCLGKLDYRLLVSENELCDLETSLLPIVRKRSFDDKEEIIGHHKKKICKSIVVEAN